MKKIVMLAAGIMLVGSFSVTVLAKTHQHVPQPNQQAVPVFLEVDEDVPADWAKQVRLTSEQAQKIALGVQPGVIKEWKLDRAGTALVYKAEIVQNWKETDVYVDAVTGQAWREHDPARKQQLVKITAEAAQKIALSKVNGSIKKIKLDEDDGQYVYEVEVRTSNRQEAELEISATTGDILSMEWDD
ncbi:PepSY domain-containing protein [Brevibacillus parabrevis]|uniref:PepSY domain-containing protein n=1 Tax=Brevibacillus parabrevis TaxID=54914 RepID=UPI002E204860|nr:PepSY domain-containing protein [Brevibacillus parabrevis]